MVGVVLLVVVVVTLEGGVCVCLVLSCLVFSCLFFSCLLLSCLLLSSLITCVGYGLLHTWSLAEEDTHRPPTHPGGGG